MRPELPTLIKARSMIEDADNWGKGSRFLRPGTYCAAEAIEGAERDLLKRLAAYEALQKAIGLDVDSESIVNWNDVPARTHADVISVFDKAIAAAS